MKTTEEQTKTRLIADLAPILRGILAEPRDSEDDPYLRAVLKWAGTSDVTNADSALLCLDAPTQNAPVEETRGRFRQAVEAHRGQHGKSPRAVLVSNVGSFTVERELVAPEQPLQNKVALVTGAAGAIGAGICRELLKRGGRVAASDIARKALDELVADLGQAARERIIGVVMDVTDEASVADGFDAVVCAWGGVDIVVANAGLAHVASLMEMDLEMFRKLEKVNIEGTLLTLAEAGRRLRLQGTGGDIILISTKNVFAPGAQFGAYSATKAAAHQLARIASLELAPYGIRVNMVAPDAVFSDGKRKSGLWAEVGPSRMKARGLDEEGLEEYYRSRNLLKARVTAGHVANAVLFFATRQTPTTGATIPVDGGLPDATPR